MKITLAISDFVKDEEAKIRREAPGPHLKNLETDGKTQNYPETQAETQKFSEARTLKSSRI